MSIRLQEDKVVELIPNFVLVDIILLVLCTMVVWYISMR